MRRLSPANLSGEVKATLDAFREGGLELAIGSSSKNAGYILERLGLEGCFDAVADGTMISRSKPDSEVFLTAARLLDLTPEDCLVAEDAVAGVEAAHAGGMKAATLGDAAENIRRLYFAAVFRSAEAAVTMTGSAGPQNGLPRMEEEKAPASDLFGRKPVLCSAYKRKKDDLDAGGLLLRTMHPAAPKPPH